MVRTYKKKNTHPEVNEADVEAAINAVINEKMPLRQAAAVYGVKHTTLFYRIQKRKPKTDSESTVDVPDLLNMDQQFSLRWNNYLNQITDAFGSLKNEEDLVDVTLSCEGKKLKAHKMLLSACSPYFKEVFKDNPCQHPVIVFRNFKYVDLEAIINFMYKGEVDVKQEHFESFLGTAELLEVKGLTEGSKSNNFDDDDSSASKMIDSGNELLPEDPDLINRPLSPKGPSRSHNKKRKNSSLPDKGKSSEKKLKGEQLSPIIPKIEQEEEELIEDLTFDEDDTDDSHSTSADLSQVPLRHSRPDVSADYSPISIPDHQDPSQLPKGKHFANKIPPTKKKAHPTRKCKVCSDKSKKASGKATRKETSWWCPDCSVALCMPHCFKLYHTRANYIN